MVIALLLLGGGQMYAAYSPKNQVSARVSHGVNVEMGPVGVSPAGQGILNVSGTVPFLQQEDVFNLLGREVQETPAVSWYRQKKFIIPAVCLLTAGTVVGILAAIGILSRSSTTTCSGENFWPVSPNLEGTTNALFKNLAGSEAFFALMSNLWILAYNQNTISGTCPPSSLIFQQKLSEFSYAIDSAVDQVALRQSIQSNGSIGCTTIADTCEFECRYRQDLSSSCAVAPIYRNKLCSIVPTINYGKQVAISFCNGVTLYTFYAPSKNFLVTATMPATSTSTTRAPTTSATALVPATSTTAVAMTTLVPVTSTTTTTFAPATSTTAVPAPTQFIPVGNCTYYDEYLAQNSTARDLLVGILCNSTQLSLIYRYSSIGDAGVVALAPALQQLTSLQELLLYADGISTAGSVTLASVLQNLVALQTLGLAQNAIESAGLKSLEPALLRLVNLRSLYLNSISSDGMETAATVIQQLINLCRLGLGSNKLGKSLAIATAWSSSLQYLTKLEYLDFSSNFDLFDDSSNLDLYTSAIEKLINLQELDLSYNSIRFVSTLALSLKKLTNLRTLDLKNNLFFDSGIVSLAPSLQQLTKLENLNLHFNSFGDDGATALASCLGTLAGLQILDLSDNRITDTGANTLGSALKQLRNLTFVKIESFFSPINTTACTNFAAAVQQGSPGATVSC